MSSKNNKDLKLILHPYLFVLKEGNTIQNDLLDYSLLMLQINCHEIIKSPKPVTVKQPGLSAELDFFANTASETLPKPHDTSKK